MVEDSGVDSSARNCWLKYLAATTNIFKLAVNFKQFKDTEIGIALT